MTRFGCVLALPIASLTLISFVTDASAERRDRLSVSMHMGGGGMADSEDENDEGIDTGVVGLTARYSLHRRWDIQVSGSAVVGESEAIRRNLGMGTIAARFKFNPDARWRWSALLGVGSAEEETEILDENGETLLTRESRHDVVEIGAGLERRYHKWGFAAELHVFGLVRDDSEETELSSVRTSSLIPEKTTVGEFRLQATYYF